MSWLLHSLQRRLCNWFHNQEDAQHIWRPRRRGWELRCLVYGVVHHFNF